MLLLPKGRDKLLLYSHTFMQISKELIEKYHDGACTAEEKKAVENWLFSEESEDDLLLPDIENKEKIQSEMWDEIAGVFPDKEKPKQIFIFKSHFNPVWTRAAAVILISMLGVAFFYHKHSSAKQDIIVVNNMSDTINKNINAKDYTISVGPKSNIEIDETGMIDFCGAMMINPKEDVVLRIKGTCTSTNEPIEKLELKKGQNYIALNYAGNSSSNEVIILREGSMMGLPPLVMRQLIQQFNI